MITNLHKTDTKRTTHLRNLTHLADGLCCLSQEHQLAMKWTQKMRNTRPANRHGTAAKRNKACQWIKEREILKIIINTLARKWLDQFFKFRTFCEPRNKKHLEQVSRALLLNFRISCHYLSSRWITKLPIVLKRSYKWRVILKLLNFLLHAKKRAVRNVWSLWSTKKITSLWWFYRDTLHCGHSNGC